MTAIAGQIRFECPSCRRSLGISSRMAGREVTCPSCRKRVIVPDGDARKGAEGGASSAAMLEVAADDGGFRLRRRRRGEVEEMDLTPMVDVTFLLLIFFMITASFSLQKTLEIPPPDPENQGASPVPLEQIEENSVVVRVEAGDTYLVDERPVGDPDDLVPALSEAMADGSRVELVIEAEDAARHEAVVRVYDAGNEVGMQKIRLATPPAE